MAANNVGVVILGCLVGIGAILAGNIWSASLHDKVDRITHATDAWNNTYRGVSNKEIDLNGSSATDLAAMTTRLKHRIENAKQLDDADTQLMRVGAGTSIEADASIAISGHLFEIEQQLTRLDSADRAAALDKQTVGIVGDLMGYGVLRNSEALHMRDEAETQETYVKDAGYALAILALIIAAVLQLTRA